MNFCGFKQLCATNSLQEYNFTLILLDVFMCSTPPQFLSSLLEKFHGPDLFTSSVENSIDSDQLASDSQIVIFTFSKQAFNESLEFFNCS